MIEDFVETRLCKLCVIPGTEIVPINNIYESIYTPGIYTRYMNETTHNFMLHSLVVHFWWASRWPLVTLVGDFWRKTKPCVNLPTV